MFLEVEILREFENLRRGGARHHYDAVSIGGDDIARIHRDTVAHDGNICAREALVPDRGRRHNAQRINRKTDFT